MASPALAQGGLRLTELGAEFGTGYLSAWENYSAVPVKGAQDLEGWLGARVHGYYGSPGFFSFRSSIRPAAHACI